MISVLEQLKVIFRTSGHTLTDVIEGTGLSRSAVRGVLSGENENPNLLTVLDIAEYLGVECTLETPESREAIDQSDITAYREMIASRDRQVDELVKITSAQHETIEQQRATIEHQRGTIDGQSKLLSRLQDSIDRKDELLRSRGK